MTHYTHSVIISTNQSPRLRSPSYWSTNPALSNVDAFPFFGRVIPGDSVAVSAAAAVCKHFGWTSVGIVHTDDSYGRAGAVQAS